MANNVNGRGPNRVERRSFPRPPLWLNLLLLVIAAATFAYAKHHRDEIRKQTSVLFQPTPANPAELNQLRDELSDMDLSREQLSKELDSRMKFLQSLQGEDFYIAIDTKSHKMEFRLGKSVVRESNVQIGEPKTINGKGKTWTLVPVKGAFTVVGKATDYAWQIPEWLYAMNGQDPPATRPTVEDGLGKYVVFLPDNYVIHSSPSANSPLKGPKPGSFMVPEADLAAIWPRITKNTRVYIF